MHGAVRAARWRAAMVGLVSAVAAAACSEGGAQVGVPSATVGTEPPTTTTTHPYAVPPVIDATYVNRVLEGLDKAYGDIVRLVLNSRGLVPQASAQLRSLFGTDRELQLELDRFQEDMRSGFRGYRNPPGNQRTFVDHIVAASSECIFARVLRDYSAVSQVLAVETEWVALSRLDISRDPTGFNTTGWAYTYHGFPPPGFPDPPNQCHV
jgi:hypothetical protein